MSAAGDALRSRAIVAAVFCEVLLQQGPIRTFAAIGQYETPDGRVWTGLGRLGAISAVTQAEKLEANGFQIGFSVGDEVNREDFGKVMEAFVADRAIVVRRALVRLYVGLFDQTAGSLIDFVLWGSGRASHLSTSWSPERLGMSLNVEPLIGSTIPTKGRFLTNIDQQLLEPGDRALEFIETLQTGGRVGKWRASTT